MRRGPGRRSSARQRPGKSLAGTGLKHSISPAVPGEKTGADALAHAAHDPQGHTGLAHWLAGRASQCSGTGGHEENSSTAEGHPPKPHPSPDFKQGGGCHQEPFKTLWRPLYNLAHSRCTPVTLKNLERNLQPPFRKAIFQQTVFRMLHKHVFQRNAQHRGFSSHLLGLLAKMQHSCNRQ